MMNGWWMDDWYIVPKSISVTAVLGLQGICLYPLLGKKKEKNALYRFFFIAVDVGKHFRFCFGWVETKEVPLWGWWIFVCLCRCLSGGPRLLTPKFSCSSQGLVKSRYHWGRSCRPASGWLLGRDRFGEPFFGARILYILVYHRQRGEKEN